jgi:hypothetical protein
MALGTQGFQTSVGGVPAPAVEGDFASINPRSGVLAGPGGLICGPDGVIVGRFAWADFTGVDWDGAPAIVRNNGSGPPTGWVHREQQGLIENYLTGAGMKVQPGREITLFNSGDFWVRNYGVTVARPGMKCYVNPADGTCYFGATGAPSTAVVTGAIAAGTPGVVVGSISGNLLTLASVTSGQLVPGAVLSGTGVVAGTKVVGLVSGTPNTAGAVYAVDTIQTVAPGTTITGTFGLLTVSAVSSGALAVGDVISGSGVTAGSRISGFGTGAGGAGTYYVDPTQAAASTTVTGNTTLETKFFCRTTGAANEIVKISDTTNP